jgi:hypothetical protein
MSAPSATGVARAPPIRVKIPANVATNLEGAQKAVASAVAQVFRLQGCLACFSGIDILFEVENEYILDQNLNIQSQALMGGE